MALDNNNSVGFELFFKDNLTNPLAQASSKGVNSLNKLENAKGGLGKSSNSLMGSLGGVTSGLASMLGPAALATGAIAALGAGIRSVVSTGMDFSKVMSNVKALTGANADEFKRLNDAAISLGASTSFSSMQVAEAMANAAAGGMEVNEIISAMPGFLSLAASSNTDLARSVEIGMAQMNAFGLEAKDMNHIVDMMSFTTVKSATAMEDLSDGLSYIGSNAHALKVPLSEILAIQGTLGDSGLKGSMATRALSTSIQRLAAPTERMDMVMKKLNLSFFDSEGKFIGIANSVSLLEDRLKGATDEQRANAISNLFGADSFSEWSILMQKGGADLKKFTAEIENSNGTASTIAKVQLENLSGDIEAMSGSWESLQLKIFSQGESGFRGMVQMATTFLSRLGESWAYITEPLSEVANLFGEVWQAIKDLLQSVGLVGNEFDALGFYFKALHYNIEIITGALKLTLKFWIWLFNAIRNGVYVVQSFWESLKNLASNIMQVFTPVGTLLEGIFTLNWDKVKSGYAGIKSGLASVFGDAGDTFRNSMTSRMNRSSVPGTSEETTLAPTMNTANGNPLLIPNAAANGSTKTNGGIDVVGSEKGSGKSVVVTINNLIGNLSVTGANMATDIQKAVAEALTNAVRDFEMSYG